MVIVTGAASVLGNLGASGLWCYFFLLLEMIETKEFCDEN